MSNEWWKKEIAYQIYPKSFKDSNGDGIGDLRGIIEKLDYLKDLGVTLLWLCPIYKSPMDDNGYDISDYYDINPEFGTMADLEELIEKAKAKGIKIIMDLVINHSSDEHAWFQEALKDPNSPYHDYYIFKSSKDGKEPNNWRSVFGGSVWQKVEGRDGYLDGPVDGQDGLSACFAYSRNQPGIEVFFDELKKETFEKHNCMTVAEAVGVQYKDLGIFIGEQGCFSMMFDFNYCNFDISEDEEWFKRQDWTTKQFKELLFTSQREVQKLGWIASFLENHDQPRAIDKFVLDKKNHNYYSQTMLAGMFFNLRGTPFIYQGEEIGMENFERESIDEFDDIGSHGQYQRALEEGFTKEEAMHFLNLRSRDNTRTPMQWDSSEYAGFSNHEPWLKMTGSQDKINVENQFNDPNSIYSFYKKMISIRKQEDTLVYGDFEEVNTVDDVIGYKRTYQGQEILCFCNFTNKEQPIPETQGNILLDNYNDYNNTTLKPYQFIMIKK